MRIRLNLNVFIFIIIFILTRQIEIYMVLIIFAIIHELAHMFTGMMLKFKPNQIELMPFGLSVSFETVCDDYNKKVKKGSNLTLKKLGIALAGPMINFILATIFIFFDIPFFGIDRQLIVYANLLMGIFNLIPLYPLDGGRIIKNLLHIFYGKEQAEKDVNIISNVTISILTGVASIAILYFKNIAILLVIIYLWYLVLIQNKIFRKKMETKRLVKAYIMSKKEDEIGLVKEK